MNKTRCNECNGSFGGTHKLLALKSNKYRISLLMLSPRQGLRAKLPAQVPYRMTPPEFVELRKHLTELLDVDLIQPLRAPYGVFVTLSEIVGWIIIMCINHRALNKVTKKNNYPIPLAPNLFDRLSKVKYFTKVNLRSRN